MPHEATTNLLQRKKNHVQPVCEGPNKKPGGRDHQAFYLVPHKLVVHGSSFFVVD